MSLRRQTSTFLEDALRHRIGVARTAFARDVYTMAHFPLVAGIVLFAVVLEEVLIHPEQRLEGISAILLAAGIALVLLTFLLVAYRTTRRLPAERFIAAGLIVAVSAFFGSLSSRVLLTVDAAILVGALAIEYVRWKKGMGRHKAGAVVLEPADIWLLSS